MLDDVDLSAKLPRGAYREQLLEYQLRLRRQARRLYRQRRSLVLVSEGWDASGKGGSIRRFTEKLDPRGYDVFSIGPPEGEEREHHYLWRFWVRLLPPEEKQILIFDRSWYGRVLVERVEGFARADEWRRAYDEINFFERQLTDAGFLLAKFWIHIDSAEQRRRFDARLRTAHKRFKLTAEDWRNRERWDEYERAVEEMMTRTHSDIAPWTVVPGNDKYFARVFMLREVVTLLENSLDATEEWE